MRGFSLVELSIVLVILGLLTGGIFAGQSLIRAAELRSIPTELQKYQTAMHAFREKYFAIPGDMTNATQFWGEVTGTCLTTQGTGTETCDGNGDGAIAPATAEVYRFWQQLANAGLIEGSYTGIRDTTYAYDVTAGVNVPLSRLPQGTWIYYTDTVAYSAHIRNYDGVIGSHFMYGGERVGHPEVAIFTSEEMWGLDAKLDDGKPGRGNVKAFHSSGFNNAGGTLNACSLATSGAEPDKDYDLNASGKVCVALFVRQ